MYIPIYLYRYIYIGKNKMRYINACLENMHIHHTDLAA